jgi:hypothetical protein
MPLKYFGREVHKLWANHRIVSIPEFVPKTESCVS